MYNPNQPGSVNPPPAAHNYGAAGAYPVGYTNQTYEGVNNNVYAANNPYDLPQQKYCYEDPPTDVIGNGGLYDDFSINEFSSTKVRHGFIRKVYIILSLQLLFTMGFSLLTVYHPPSKLFVRNYILLFLVLSLILTFPVMLAITCFTSLGRKYPTNYILLSIITIGMTCMVVALSSVVKENIFLYALLTTTGVTIGLTLFSFQTKYDFTGWGVYLLVGFIILFILGIIASFVSNRTFNLVYAGIGAFLVSCSIILDTQLIVGGKHRKFQYSIDDYVFATLSLYVDIINLFLFILTLFSQGSDN